jgi:hypothetical protein
LLFINRKRMSPSPIALMQRTAFRNIISLLPIPRTKYNFKKICMNEISRS